MRVNHVDRDGVVTRGYGDTSFALKYHYVLSEKTALGVEAGFKSPTAKAGLGSGKTDSVLNGIVSVESSTAQFDLNLGVTRLGAYANNEGRHEIAWAVSASRPLVNKWNMAVEFSGTGRLGTSNTDQFLAAVSYEWSQRTAFDIGASKGLNDSTPRWNVFTGIAMLLGEIK